MKIIEKEKEMEKKELENHVKNLEYEQTKAQKQLAKTLHTIDLATIVQQRKDNDFNQKMMWLKEKHDKVEM